MGAASGGVPPGSPDFDDLPWQVVAIMSVEKMEELWEQKQRHDSMLGGLLGATPHANPEPSSTDTGAADEACADRRFDDGVWLYDEVLDSIGGGGTSTDAARATVRARKAGCLRRAHRPADALAELARAPLNRDPAVLMQKGLALLDVGDPVGAVATFELVLAVDRYAEDLDRWMVHAHARARRRGIGPVGAGFRVGDRVQTVKDYDGLWRQGEFAVVKSMGTPGAPMAVRFERTRKSKSKTINSQAEHFRRWSPDSAIGGADLQPEPASELDSPAATLAAAVNEGDQYSVLGLPADFARDELKKAFRSKSKMHHPDRGGSVSVFASLSAAYELLGDPVRRRAFDTGADLPREEFEDLHLVDEVERRYWPERIGFRAFGDPHEQKRTIQMNKEQQESGRDRRDEL